VQGEKWVGIFLLALFEITPQIRTVREARPISQLAKVTLNYKLPNDTLERMIPILPHALTPFEQLQPVIVLLLRSPCSGDAEKIKIHPPGRWKDAIELAERSRILKTACKRAGDPDREARKIYGKERHRKKNE